MNNKYQIKTLREQVYGFIKSKIINGEIKPGEKINEYEFAKELGISRGPVREALRQIEQEGLVQYMPNRGCMVTKLTDKEMYEMGMIRANLEMLAADVCEGNFSDATIHILEQCVDEMEKYEKEKALEKVIEADQKFHEAIVKEPGLLHLQKLWHTLDGTNVAIFFCRNYDGRLCESFLVSKNHRRFVEGIKTKELDRIKKELKWHYMGAVTYADVISM